MPDTLSLPQIATVLNSSHRAEFQSFLKERFTVGDFDPRYKIIDGLPIKSIFTTNIDNLLHEIFNDSTSSYLNGLRPARWPRFLTVNAIDLIALHGCVLDDSRELTFGRGGT